MTKRVMIVEDNELNMKLFRDLIEASGYETIRTRSGLEALDLAREHHPDLILMDIQLPEVSGLDVTKWLKADDELKHIPVIAVTAFAMKGDEEKIRQGGCEDYISKPISVGRFVEVIQTYLNKTPDVAVVTEDIASAKDDEPEFEIIDRAEDDGVFAEEDLSPEEGSDIQEHKETDNRG